MKRTISFILSIVMVLSVFVAAPFIKVDAEAADVSKLFTVELSGFENGNVTYTLYLNPGVGVSGSVIFAEFDPAVVKLVSGGAAMAVDAYGDEYQKIPGMYVNGFVSGYNNRYSVGFLSNNLSSDYICGKSKTPFLQFEFKIIGTGDIETFVKFYCNEFTSLSVPENKIEKDSNVLIKKAPIIQSKPATPKLSKVVNTASGVQVTWNKVSGADDYIVYRRTYNAKTKAWSGWSRIAKGVTSTSYVDKTAKSGTYYIYTVKANNEAGYGGHTSGLKIYFLATPKVTTANSNSGVTVKWNKIAGASGYIVYRRTTDGWTKVATVKGNGSVSYTDKTAKAGVTYRYTVRAYYSSYLSYYNTNGVAVRRLTTPSLKSVTSAKSGVTLKWNKVTGATGYIVYRKTGNGSWQKLSTFKGNSKVSYLDKTAKKGTTYTYTVRAYYGTSTSYYNTKGLTIKDKY